MTTQIDHFNRISATHIIDGSPLTIFRGEPWLYEPLSPLAFRMQGLAASDGRFISQVDTDTCQFTRHTHPGGPLP